MPKPPRTTENAFGRKLLEVLADKGRPNDLAYLAQVFGVKQPSVYDWIDHGRFAKDRYAQLVAWSERSLHWWFDVPTEVTTVAEPSPGFGPRWPFKTLPYEDIAALDTESLRMLEGAILALAGNLGLRIKARAA